MTAKFHHGSHSIEFKRSINGARLFINGAACDKKTDVFAAHLTKYTLEGTAGSDKIRITVKPGFFKDQLACYCNDRLIGEKTVFI